MPTQTADFQDPLLAVLDVAARRLAQRVSFADFRTEMVGTVQFLFAAAPDSPLNDPEAGPLATQALATQLALQLWNSIPVAANHFRPNRQAPPERNAPCLCGSGLKFKQCCGLFSLPDLRLDPAMLLGIVLGQQPRAALLAMPLAELPPPALAQVAETWANQGQIKSAITLLESLFKDLDRLDARAEIAADMLCNLYFDANKPRKKQQFIDQLKHATDKTLAASGWQRQASIDCDAGKLDAAWQAFQQAQRLEPNHPALAHLEILLLISQDRREEARARARFWSARLARDKHNDHSELIALITSMADGSPARLLACECEMGSPLGQLFAALADWPAPARHYRLSADGRLQADPALAKVEKAWFKQQGLLEAAAADQADEQQLADLLDLLASQPLCAQSFTIIADLLMLIDAFPAALPGSSQALRLQLLERANILRLIVLPAPAAQQPAPAQQAAALPWGWLENRPVLQLLAGYARHGGATQPEATLAALRWAVYHANPNDNLGLREPLLHRLIAVGQADEALALCACYPDDLPAMQYGQVLARFVAGQHEAAALALRQVRADYPKIWKTLSAANPRAPRLHAGWSTHGGDDEAWYYREDYRDLWEKTGALAWAASIKTRRARPVQEHRGKR